MSVLSHFDDSGAARMVDVSGKDETVREAVAAGRVQMQTNTLRLILDRRIEKGDVLAVARIAGILASKRTAEIVPLCHPLNLSSVEVAFEPETATSSINIIATVRCKGTTGVEMEALCAVAAAGLSIYDMCKSADRGMTVTDIRLLRKSGGASGTYERPHGS